MLKRLDVTVMSATNALVGSALNLACEGTRPSLAVNQLEIDRMNRIVEASGDCHQPEFAVGHVGAL